MCCVDDIGSGDHQGRVAFGGMTSTGDEHLTEVNNVKFSVVSGENI